MGLLNELKFETYNLIKNYIKMVKTQFQVKIKAIRSDNGSEFTSTIQQFSCLYTPEQNSRVWEETLGPSQ